MAELNKILFVDDEQFIVNTLRDLFDDEYQVFTATNPIEALEIVKTNTIKMVVSDQRMPEMLGHQLLREIRKVSPNTVRILLTGYSDLDAIINSVNTGEIFRYINKPWNTEKLIQLIDLGVKVYDRVVALQKQKDAVPTQTHIEVREKSASVLFVDYNPNEVQTLIQRYGDKYDVAGVTSADEAFKALAAKPVSVIVSNVNFHDIDGIDFLSAVRREYPETVTVILTEIKDALIAVRSINQLHVFKYFVKPANDVELDKTLSDAISASKHYRERPQTNIHTTAETVSPELKESSSASESSLLLRLRAMQMLTSRLQERK
jgi:DNA-binding NtrC family response regulator